MSPKIVNKKRKREEILRAALKVFARQGIHGFKMMDIAEEAGIGKGTLYESFSSKEELIGESFALLLEDHVAYVGERLAMVDDPVGKIRTLVKASCGFFTEQKKRLEVIFDLWSAGVPGREGKMFFGDLTSFYCESRDWLVEIIQDGIKQGVFETVDAELASSIILAILDGIMFQAVLGLINIDDKSLPDRISQIVFKGIEK